MTNGISASSTLRLAHGRGSERANSGGCESAAVPRLLSRTCDGNTAFAFMHSYNGRRVGLCVWISLRVLRLLLIKTAVGAPLLNTHPSGRYNNLAKPTTFCTGLKTVYTFCRLCLSVCDFAVDACPGLVNSP